MSNVDELSKRLAAVAAKTPGQLERLAEITARIQDDEADDGDMPQCGFHARNPSTGTLGQCISPIEGIVIVAVTRPDGTFNGDGVRVGVCERHGRELESTYKAIAVPVADATAPEADDD